jgi:type IV secretory pathway VirB2 component (pilin)
MSSTVNRGWFSGSAASSRVCLAMVIVFYAGAALAGGSSDPLGSGMCRVVELLTGKWAFGLSVVALLGVGAAFLFGVEMSEVMKKLVTLITAVAFVVFGGNILKFIFPSMVGC